VKEKIYNPADDGLAAKAWECLRRNPEFRHDRNFRGARSQEEAEHSIAHFRARMSSHPFYQAVFLHLRGWTPYTSHDDDRTVSKFSPIDESMAWPELDPLAQGSLEDSLARLDVMTKEIPVSDRTHRPIWIPVNVWDARHKADLLLQVSALLGRPIAKDARWLKNPGRTLGTRAQWKAFLLTEKWRTKECGEYGIRIAASLAAYEIYGKTSLGDSPKERCAAAKEFRRETPKLHPQTSSVEAQSRALDSAIGSVYPTFLTSGI